MTGQAAALVVLVPEAEPVIGASRTLHTQDGAAGMPAHVTLLYPFAPIGAVDIDAVRDDRRGDPAVCVRAPRRPRVAGRRRLPRATTGRALRRAHAWSAARFPDYPPYGGIHDDVVPHVTVVHTGDPRARADAAASVAGSLPIRCDADEIWLMHEVNGRWRGHTPFPLGR